VSLVILPLISTIFIAISAIFVAIGWMVVSKGNKELHKKVMFLGALFAVLFFATYLSKMLFIGSTSFGGPEEVKIYYTIFLIFHIALATSAAGLGITALISGYKNNLKLHRKIGVVTAIAWFMSASTGIVVYLLLYVLSTW
jgi:putative membrane protein